MGTAKGSIFVHTRKFVGQTSGDPAWASLVEKLPPDDRELLSGLLLAGTWYPVGIWNRLMRAFVKANSAEAVIDLSRYIAAEDLNIIFRMLLKMGSPEFVLKRVGSIYLRYFDKGTLTASEAAPRDWRLQLDASTDDEGGPGELVCTYGVGGWITEALVRTGATHAQVVHVRCRFRGSSACEYHVKW